MTLATYQHNWECPNCFTMNAPDYYRCQECRADIDGEYSADEAQDGGYEAWNADKPLSACPYPHDSDAAIIWREAWHTAQAENSQFGVGA